jgi:hypothetical protein
MDDDGKRKVVGDVLDAFNRHDLDGSCPTVATSGPSTRK